MKPENPPPCGSGEGFKIPVSSEKVGSHYSVEPYQVAASRTSEGAVFRVERFVLRFLNGYGPVRGQAWRCSCIRQARGQALRLQPLPPKVQAGRVRKSNNVRCVPACEVSPDWGWCVTARHTGRCTLATDSSGTAVRLTTAEGVTNPGRQVRVRESWKDLCRSQASEASCCSFVLFV